MSSYDPQPLLREGALEQPAERVDSRAVLGQVMGLVAVTVGFFALGAYLGRDLSGGTGLALFVAGFACAFGLNIAVRRSETLGIVLLFAMGLLLGMALGTTLAYYAESDPDILVQSAGATALFVGALGSYGYATKRDLSSWARTLFWLLIGLIVFGIVLIFVNIPGGALVYSVLGLVIFAGFTMFDFQRIRTSTDINSAPFLAASIFLDILNVFLFFLQIFSGGRD